VGGFIQLDFVSDGTVVGLLGDAVLVDDIAHGGSLKVGLIYPRMTRIHVNAAFAGKQKAPAPSGRRVLLRSPVAT
jgi:hypothetical protein